MVDMIVPGYNNADKNADKKIIDLVMNNRNESENWIRSSGYFDEFQSWNDLYRGIPPKKPYAWMSNKFIPLVNAQVETATSQIMGLLFSANPCFAVKPRERSDEEQAKLIQSLLAHQFEESEVYREFMTFVRSIAIYGTGVGKIIWEYRPDDRIIMQPTNPIMAVMSRMFGMNAGMQPMQSQGMIGYPKLITCNIGDIYPDPRSVEIQDSWVVHRLYRSKAYLQSLAPMVYNEQVMAIQDSEGTEEDRVRQETLGSLGRQTNANVTRPAGTRPIELNEWHGLYDLDGDGKPERCVFTVAAGKYLIRKQSKPYWHGKNPFIKATYIPAINEFFGVGIPELLEDVQQTINEIFNQRNDNISLCLNRPFIYKKGAGIDTRRLILKPGGVYGTDEDVNQSLIPMPIEMYTRDAFAHINDLERWAQEVTGVTKLTMGMMGKDQNDTATGMSILQRASGERFMSIARGIEQTAFKEMIRMFYQLDYQFIDQTQVIGILGEKGMQWVSIPPEVVKRDYDFVPAGIFSIENKQAKSLRLIQYKQITQGEPWINAPEIDKKIYYAMDIGDNPEEIILPDAMQSFIMGMAQMMAEKKFEAMQQAEMEGGGSGKSPKKEKPKTGGNTSSEFKKDLANGNGQVPPPTSVNAGNPSAMP